MLVPNGVHTNVRVIVHAGLHKTGSTSIQNTFFENRVSLREHGILFPRTGLTERNPQIGRRHLDLRRCLEDEGPHGHGWQVLREELKHSACHTAVLSYEGFFSKQVDPNLIRIALGDADVWAVIYLRNPIDYVESKYRERVVNARFSGDPGPFIEQCREYLDVSNLFDGWRRAFGAERVVAKSFDHVQQGSNLAREVLSAAGVDTTRVELRLTDERNPTKTNDAVLTHLIRNQLHWTGEVYPNDWLHDFEVAYEHNGGRLLNDQQVNDLEDAYGEAYRRTIRSLGLKSVGSKWAARPFDRAFFSVPVREKAKAEIRAHAQKRRLEKEAAAREKEAEKLRRSAAAEKMAAELRSLREEVRHLRKLKFWKSENWPKYPALARKRLLRALKLVRPEGR